MRYQKSLALLLSAIRYSSRAYLSDNSKNNVAGTHTFFGRNRRRKDAEADERSDTGLVPAFRDGQDSLMAMGPPLRVAQIKQQTKNLIFANFRHFCSLVPRRSLMATPVLG